MRILEVDLDLDVAAKLIVLGTFDLDADPNSQM